MSRTSGARSQRPGHLRRSQISVRIARSKKELTSVARYMSGLLNRSGLDGAPRYSTFLPGTAPRPRELEGPRWTGWKTPLSNKGWIRTWYIRSGNQVVGHLELRPGRHKNRVSLWMGLSAKARGQGYGSALLEKGIAYARQQGFRYIDLGVFAENTPARSLYKKYGFRETKTVPAAFEIGGRPVDDVHMTLDVGVRRNH